MTKKQILNYLNVVFCLEKSKYEQNAILNRLSKAINSCNKVKFYDFENEPKKPSKYTYFTAFQDIFDFIYWNWEEWVGFVSLIIAAIIFFICIFVLADFGVNKPVILSIIIAVT